MKYNQRHSLYSSSGQIDRSAARILKIMTVLIAVVIFFIMVELVILASINARLNDISPPPADTEGEDIGTPPPEDTTPADTPVIADPSPVRLAETPDMGDEYLKKIIFVGDSTTYGLIAYGVLDGGKNTKQVWVPESGTYSLNNLVTTYKIVYPETGEQMTVAEAAKLAKPEYMVITLGVNYGVPYCGEGEFKKYYRMLLDAVTTASPETKIMLQSIYPVATNNKLKDITNEKIDLANTWIEQLAEEYNLKYLNTNSSLKGEDGYLIKSYENGDGLHLMPQGLRAVLQYIRTHGYPQE